MELVLLNELGKEIGKHQVSDEVFGREYNEALIHQVVVAYQANMRGGNRAQKDRAEVKHTTKKPWKQKGTGRARAGMSSSPLWRGGGKIFPNSPEENFSQKVNRKMYRAAVKAIYSQLAREGRLSVVESLTIDTPKTKEAATKFKNFGDGRIMFITGEVTEQLYLATRNIHTIDAREARFVDPYSLLKSHKVLITKEAIAQVEGLLV